MEAAQIGRKKSNRHLQPGELRRHNRSVGLIEENEKMVEELQQQVIQIERKLTKKKYDSYNLDYEWTNGGEWRCRSSKLNCRKMELDIITFAHGAYRDKKIILSFSSGEPEVNIHNLSYRILHEARSASGERRLLSMMNPNKHSNSGVSLDDFDQQVKNLHLLTIYDFNQQIGWLDHELMIKRGDDSDQKKYKRKIMELEKERDQLYGNSPIKGLLWNSLPSTMSMDLRKEVQALETIEEEKRKVFSEKRKKIESNKRELRKAENEIKALRKKIEKIQQRKQKALQTL